MIEDCGLDLIMFATANSVNADSKTAIFCCNCSSTLKSKRCPKLSIANGMELDEIPEELGKATDLEQQLFARMLVFTKIVKMPKNFMPGMTGKMINVPLEQSDISNTMKVLPRCADEAAIVALQLKKKQELKSAYAESYIRPTVCLKAVQKLKEIKNPFYTNVIIDEKFMEKGKRYKDDEENEEKSDTEKSETEQADIEILNSVKENQADHDENTCLIREDLESIIVENRSNETIYKKKGKGVISIAPGENKVNLYDIIYLPILFTETIHTFSRYQIFFWQMKILM